MKLKNELGNRYGRLVVLKRAGSYRYRGTRSVAATWLCQCDCGNTTVVSGSHLRSGRVQSCGCLNAEKSRLPIGEAAFRRLLRSYKGRAKHKNLLWALDDSTFRDLVSQRCYYCGAQPSNVMQDKHFYGAFTYNGLDRINNTRGYEADNVVPCCALCNRAKGTTDHDWFVQWLDNLAAFRLRRPR